MISFWLPQGGWIIFQSILEVLSLPIFAFMLLLYFNLLGYKFRKNNFIYTKDQIKYILIVATLFVAVIVNLLHHHFIHYEKLLIFVVSVLLSYLFIHRKSENIFSYQKGLLNVFVILLSIYLIYVVSQLGTLGTRGFPGVATPSINAVGTSFIILFIIALYEKIYTLAFIAVSLAVLAVFYTQSRTSMLVLVWTVTIILLLSQRFSIFFKLVAVIVFLPILWFVYELSGVSQRTDVLLSSAYENTIRFRNLIYFYESFTEDMIFGAGLFSQPRLRFDAHNYVLEALLQGGVIVGVIMVVYYFFNIYLCIKFVKEDAPERSVIISVVLLRSLFTGSFLLSPEFFIIPAYFLSCKKYVSNSRTVK